jgi:hypothetical protein
VQFCMSLRRKDESMEDQITCLLMKGKITEAEATELKKLSRTPCNKCFAGKILAIVSRRRSRSLPSDALRGAVRIGLTNN